VGLDDLGQGERRHLAAAVFTAIGFLTSLLALRCINAVQPDLRAADPDRVTVYDARLAF